MNRAAELLDPERVLCKEPIRSKKRALERAASLLAGFVPATAESEIFEALNGRERLGSTGLGHGMALPHGRIGGLDAPIAACITLDEPIDFDAPDRQRVDVLYILLVPSNCSREHLQILAGLAEMFNDAGVREQLREETSAEGLINRLDAWQPADTAGNRERKR